MCDCLVFCNSASSTRSTIKNMHAQTSHFNGEVFSKVSEVKTDVIAYFDFSRVLLPSRLHSCFVIRILFFRRRLDILFFLPI